MKPNTTQAMRNLIAQIKATLTLEINAIDACSGQCNACHSKLVDFILMEIEDWESRLNSGEIPNFKDLSTLEKTGRKIYSALDKRGFID